MSGWVPNIQVTRRLEGLLTNAMRASCDLIEFLPHRTLDKWLCAQVNSLILLSDWHLDPDGSCLAVFSGVDHVLAIFQAIVTFNELEPDALVAANKGISALEAFNEVVLEWKNWHSWSNA